MMSCRSILIIGPNGMLGSAFKAALPDRPLQVATHRDFSGLDGDRVAMKIADSGADVVINCAADTDVESAEDAPRRAMLANAILPKMIARGCRKRRSLLVHFSSTGCYGAYKIEPYCESDALKPTTVHHYSKAAGERAIREIGCDAMILRLGWLYGGEPGLRKNFVWARLAEASGSSSIGSNPLQVGCPTFVEDVVRQTQVLVEAGARGTFNCVGTGRASRFDYVKHIIWAAGLTVDVRPQTFARKAPVSMNEAAVNAELDRLGLNVMPAWTESLTGYVRRLCAREEGTGGAPSHLASRMADAMPAVEHG